MKLYVKYAVSAIILGTVSVQGMQIPREEDFDREKDFFLVKNEIVNKVGQEFRSGHFPFSKGLLNREVLQAEYLYDKESIKNPYRFPDIRHLFYTKKDLYSYINNKIKTHDDWLRFTQRFIAKNNLKAYDTYVNFSGVPFSQRFMEFVEYETLEKQKWEHLLIEVKNDPQSYLLQGPLHPHKITGVDVLHDNGATGEGGKVIVWDCGFVANKYINFDFNHEKILDPALGDEFGSADEHGTHVAGTIAGVKHARKNKGVAFEASVLPVAYNGIPEFIEKVKDSDAKIISASFHFLLKKDNQGYLDLLADELEKKDRLLVMAAGNDGKFLDKSLCPDFLEFWARGMWVGNHMAMIFDKNSRLAKRMLLVGSLKEDGHTVSRFSNLPGQLAEHFVFSPGENVVSTVAFDDFGKKSGTSMATPHVSGILVLMNKYYPNLSATELKECLIKSCDPFWEEKGEVPFNPSIHGWGRVNAVKAMEEAEKMSKEKAWHDQTRSMIVSDDMEVV